MSQSSYNHQTIIKQVLIGCLLLAFPAFSWKISTHIASANKALEELQTYPQAFLNPVGSSVGLFFRASGNPLFINVDSKDAYDAITQFPEYFRGGAAGPDAFPDMVSGQLFAHGNESETAKSIVSSASGGVITTIKELDPGTTLDGRTSPAYYRSVDFAMLMLDMAKNKYSFRDERERKQVLAYIMGYFSHLIGVC